MRLKEESEDERRLGRSCASMVHGHELCHLRIDNNRVRYSIQLTAGARSSEARSGK